MILTNTPGKLFLDDIYLKKMTVFDELEIRGLKPGLHSLRYQNSNSNEIFRKIETEKYLMSVYKIENDSIPTSFYQLQSLKIQWFDLDG